MIPNPTSTVIKRTSSKLLFGEEHDEDSPLLWNAWGGSGRLLHDRIVTTPQQDGFALIATGIAFLANLGFHLRIVLRCYL
jgi:hypothetical protein